MEPVKSFDRNDVAHIGKSVLIKGELSGSEDLFLDGEVEGKIELRGHARVRHGPIRRLIGNNVAGGIHNCHGDREMLARCLRQACLNHLSRGKGGDVLLVGQQRLGRCVRGGHNGNAGDEKGGERAFQHGVVLIPARGMCAGSIIAVT